MNNLLPLAQIGGEVAAWRLLRHRGATLPIGSGSSIFLCSVFAEWLELRSPPGTRAYSGKWGFDPDDALYLMAPLAWFGWLSGILVGATVGATAMMLITGIRLFRLRGESKSAA